MGIILTRSTTATAGEIRTYLAEGASRVGRRPDEVTVTTLLPTAIGETRQQALDTLRPGLAFYAGFFPRYNRLLALPFSRLSRIFPDLGSEMTVES